MDDNEFEKFKRKIEDRLNAIKQDQEKNGIGNRIKRLRAKEEITGKQLAELVFMSQSAISDIENGKRAIDCYALPLFAIALNTTVDYLCSGYNSGNLDISVNTGLSNEALETLKGLKGFHNTQVADLLNLLLHEAQMMDEEGNLKGLPQETIGQTLLHELARYIYYDDTLLSYDIGKYSNGEPIKKYVTGRDLGIFQIKACLDALARIHSNIKKGEKRNETCKR